MRNARKQKNQLDMVCRPALSFQPWRSRVDQVSLAMLTAGPTQGRRRTRRRIGDNWPAGPAPVQQHYWQTRRKCTNQKPLHRDSRGVPFPSRFKVSMGGALEGGPFLLLHPGVPMYLGMPEFIICAVLKGWLTTPGLV